MERKCQMLTVDEMGDGVVYINRDQFPIRFIAL